MALGLHDIGDADSPPGLGQTAVVATGRRGARPRRRFRAGRDIRILQQGLGSEVPVPAPPVARPEDAGLGIGRKMQLGGNGLLVAPASDSEGA